MDVHISGWILEFLLRQRSLDDDLLVPLLRVLPLPNNNPSLKKSFLLRKINSDVKNCTVSERTLDFLEQIEVLDRGEGNCEVSEAMKVAYCTVAVHCTEKRIDVRRIWQERVSEMERLGEVGLVSDDLLKMVDDVETGGRDVRICESVYAKYKELDVMEVIRVYLSEAEEKMGPTFLELAAEATLREIVDLDGCDHQIKDGALDVGANANSNSQNDEMCNSNVPPIHKHTAERGTRSGTDSGDKTVDTTEPLRRKYDLIPTPVVNKALKALKTSTFELMAALKDLPDALPLAPEVHTAPDPLVGNPDSANMGAPSSSNATNGEDPQTNRDDGFHNDQNRRPKPSLIERNTTAHTIEWSDSIDESSEGGSPSPPRIYLPTPQHRPVSPLKKYEMKKLKRLRTKKRWTPMEEDTLRAGVQKYGIGNWKLILTMHRDIFEDRTEVDLKDKWRNLTR